MAASGLAPHVVDDRQRRHEARHRRYQPVGEFAIDTAHQAGSLHAPSIEESRAVRLERRLRAGWSRARGEAVARTRDLERASHPPGVRRRDKLTPECRYRQSRAFPAPISSTVELPGCGLAQRAKGTDVSYGNACYRTRSPTARFFLLRVPFHRGITCCRHGRERRSGIDTHRESRV